MPPESLTDSRQLPSDAVRVRAGRASAPVLLVHAGAWAIPEEEREAHRRGVRSALETGFAVLERSGSALDAVEAAVSRMEDDPALNAGTGSVLDRDGAAVLDAGIMEGRSLRAGAVAGVRTIRNPVRVARRVLEATPHVLLSGTGAERFACEEGFEPVDPAALVTPRERARLAPHRGAAPADTVGAVALDASGRIAVAGSTGGTPGKLPGRVGDTPQVGAGLYADSSIGGAVATGWGEGVLRVGACRAAILLLETGATPREAAALPLARLLERLSGRAGVLLLTPDGRFAAAHTTPFLAWGLRDASAAPPAALLTAAAAPAGVARGAESPPLTPYRDD